MREQTAAGFRLNGLDFIVEIGPKAHALTVEYPSFVIMKTPSMLDEYDRQLGRLSIQDMLEIGVMRGGGTAYFNSMFKPVRHMAIDHYRHETGLPLFAEAVAKEGRRLLVRQDIGQQQTAEIITLFEATFDRKANFDVIIDDASHAYNLSLASFNSLFPRIRPGGIYVIEDWGWAHWPHFQDPARDDYSTPALSNLVSHCVFACTADNGGIQRVDITADAAFVHRGSKELPANFRIENAYPTRNRTIQLI